MLFEVILVMFVTALFMNGNKIIKALHIFACGFHWLGCHLAHFNSP
jgi:hypothetical protein